jgi:two-component system, NtrC family, sensor kinase
MNESNSIQGRRESVPPDPAFPFGRRRRLRHHSRVLLTLARSQNLASGQLANALREISETSASALEIERVSIWMFNGDRSTMRCADLFQRAEQRHSEGMELEAVKFPKYFEALAEERTIAAHDAHSDPRTREFAETYLKPLDIQSMLDVPVRVAGSMVGVVCHEDVGARRHWSAVEQGFAASIGDFVALAIEASERKRAEDLLREYNRQLEERVDERTRELTGKNAQLERALEQLRDTQDQLVIREKLASLGSLVAGIAHEVNTPIGAIIAAADISDRCLAKIVGTLQAAGRVECFEEGSENQEYVSVLRENNRVIASAADRISALVRSLRSFARLDEAELQLADLHDGIENTLSLIEHEWLGHVSVERQFGAIPKIWCYPNQLNQVFFSLFINASQAMRSGGRLTVATSMANGDIRVRISDTGKGILQEHLGRIFDPGFTTKGVGVGTGLGLSISHNIVSKHGGRMTVTSTPGKGSDFVISLPVREPGGVPGAGISG